MCLFFVLRASFNSLTFFFFFFSVEEIHFTGFIFEVNSVYSDFLWLCVCVFVKHRLQLRGELPGQRLPGGHNAVHDWTFCLRRGLEHNHPHSSSPQDEPQHGSVQRSVAQLVVFDIVRTLTHTWLFRSSSAIQALRSVLSSFSVVNRKNMFVYQERTTKSVFYLRSPLSLFISLSISIEYWEWLSTSVCNFFLLLWAR